jgi:hypothetical protein
MAKIKRKLMAHFIDASATGEANYVRLGSGIEEMSIEMSANVVKTNDITGTTETYIDKYEKTQAVEPYFANDGDPMFERLQAIVDEDKTLDELKTTVVDVKLWEEAENGSYPAIREEAIIEVVSWGGSTDGYQIPFNIHRTGVKTSGMFDPETKTFTAN